MAIFNRRDEIEMMKLIGADKSFIRGPFVVEAIVYGFIAALVATLIGLTVLILWSPNLQSYGIVMQPTVDFLTSYIGFVLLGMIFLGALVGTISSLLATRRYLKI
jgi:cell division transport system permease protein